MGPQWAAHQCPYVPYGALLPLTDMEVGAYCRSKMLLIHKVFKNWLPEQCHTFDLQDIHCFPDTTTKEMCKPALKEIHVYLVCKCVNHQSVELPTQENAPSNFVK